MKVPALIAKPGGEVHEEARRKNNEEKEKQKSYADKHRKAKQKKVEKGDQVLIKQDKTTTKPPWNPEPFTVEEVKGTKIVAKKGELSRTRNVEKFKILKQRPDYLQTKTGAVEKMVEEAEEDDWMEEVMVVASGQPETRAMVEEEAGAEEEGEERQEHPSLAPRTRKPPTRYDPADMGPQRLQRSPRQRKKAQSEARHGKKESSEGKERVRMPSGEWRPKF